MMHKIMQELERMFSHLSELGKCMMSVPYTSLLVVKISGDHQFLKNLSTSVTSNPASIKSCFLLVVHLHLMFDVNVN